MMLNLRRSAARYEVFCPVFGGDTPKARANGPVRWRRLTRVDIPFNAPTHIAGVDGDEEREPFVDAPSLAFLAQCVSVATVCFRVETNDTVTSDLAPLQAAMRIALELALLHSGIIVDCTTGIGYVAARFARLCAKAGCWQHEARDTIIVEELLDDGYTQLRTLGMVKYGVPELLLAPLLAEHVALGRALLYDQLCPYAIRTNPVRDGEVLQFLEDDASVRLYCEMNRFGEMLVRDAHPTQARALRGLERFVRACAPMNGLTRRHARATPPA
jgi:hypothetical protein